MSQFGMQMPGGAHVRKATPDVYTGLMLFAFVALLSATVFVFFAGQRVGPDGNALGLQNARAIKLADTPKP
jgi:hypothetical protein